jgi:RHS repeat-associated core domain
VSYSYTVNARQLVANETVVGAGASTSTLTRLYDEMERPTGISLGNGYAQQYAYDNESRVSAVSNAHFTARYAYEDGYSTGYIITLPNGNTLAYAVSRDQHRRHLITGVTNLFNGTVVSSFAYTHDALGRIITRNNDTFGYNARSELTSAIHHTNAYGYVTDPIGNRLVTSVNSTETSYTANALNQYSQISVTSVPPWLISPTYDLDGNLLTRGTFAYGWDAENRLASVFSNGMPILANAYDHRHRRVRKITPGAVRNMVYDGWNLIQETITPTAGPVTTNRYHWGLDMSGTLQGAGGVGGLLAAEINGLLLFPLYDNNGNVTECLDTSGNVRAHYEYDAFGGITAMSGDLASTFRFRFSTKYLDAETHQYYYGYRFYSPEQGRWLNYDPIAEEGGLNLYGFVGNDGVNHFDSLGQMSMPWGDMHTYYSSVVEPHFRKLKENLARELQALCPEKPKLWKPPEKKNEICCQPSSCKDKAQEMADAYVAVLKDVWWAERQKHGNVHGGVRGNTRVWWASVSWACPYGDPTYGDGFNVDDWKDGNGLKCDGWSTLIDQKVNDSLLKNEDDCWRGGKVHHGERPDGRGGHVWYRLQTPNGTKELDPWPSGGWSY